MSHPPHRTSFWFSTVIPTLLVVLGVGVLYALLTRAAPPVREIPAEQPPLVDTVTVSPHHGTLDLQVDGLVTPYREVELWAEVAGRVVHKSENCRAGRFVTKGPLLFEIDAREYELDLRRLNEQLRQSQANLAECDVEAANTDKLIQLAEEEYELQKKELSRVAKLVGEAASESELDKAKRGEWMSRNNLLTLQNQLRLTASRRNALQFACQLVSTQIEKAELDLERTKISSPVDGVVVRDVVEQNSYVQKGTLLAVVEDTSKVEVRCNLKMVELLWLWRQPAAGGAADGENSGCPHESVPAQAADVNLSGLDYELPKTPVTVAFRLLGGTTTYKWRGTLTRFEGAGLDEKTRTVPCRVTVDDPRQVEVAGEGAAPRALVRGMFVSLTIHAQPPANFVRIPEAAVQPGKMVLRVRDGKLQVVGPLELIDLAEERSSDGRLQKFWIAHPRDSDLAAKDSVVVSPLPTAHAGMAVREHPRP